VLVLRYLLSPYPGREEAPSNAPGPERRHQSASGGFAQLEVLTTLASMEYLISLALERARRILGSDEPSSNVMSLLQYWQLV
jgi:hypothetical protein